MKGQTVKERFEDKIYYSPDGCWYWVSSYGGRDERAKIWVNGKSINAAKVSYELYKGIVTNGLHILHTCDNPKCVNPDHLYLGTHIDNMRDRHTRHPVNGEKHPANKLTDSDIIYIRNSNESFTNLAKQLHVAISTIARIKHRTRWKHI